MKKTILYIHGVGGENSNKYTELKNTLPEYNVIKPVQDKDVAKTVQTIEQLIETSENEKFVLVGSSRGGLIALNIAYKYDIPVIAINPALEMSKVNFDIGNRDYLKELADYVIAENSNIENSRLTNLILGSEDEVIDYRVAEGLNSMTTIVKKTDHRFSRFNEVIDDIKEIINEYDIVATESDMFDSVFAD